MSATEKTISFVVCEACSARRAILPNLGAAGVRVCDAAFNLTRHLGRLADAQDAAAAQHARTQAAAATSAAGAPAAASMSLPEATARAELLGGGSSGASAAGGKAAHARQAASAGSAAHEAMNALHERGEKLNTLNDRVAALGNEAEDFYDMAKKLRQNAERQSRWLPF